MSEFHIFECLSKPIKIWENREEKTVLFYISEKIKADLLSVFRPIVRSQVAIINIILNHQTPQIFGEYFESKVIHSKLPKNRSKSYISL